MEWKEACTLFTVHWDGTQHSDVCSHMSERQRVRFPKRHGVAGARGGPRTICSEGFDWSEYVLSGLNFSLYMFRNYFFKKTCLGSFREERNSHFVAVCYKVPLKH